MSFRRIISTVAFVSLFSNFGFAADADLPLPRAEHPRPQFVRDSWVNLNGQWDFAMDPNVVGKQKNWQNDALKFDKKITVPFCMESQLSGIGHTGFMNAVWYKRQISVPKSFEGKRVFLNFGGVDFYCKVWMNGQSVGDHFGGSSSFEFEITKALKDGKNELVVYVFDDVRSDVQPSGKQSTTPESQGCSYTRVTGIWQTVWLEARPETFLDSVQIVPDLDGKRFILTPTVKDYKRGIEFRLQLLDDQGKRLETVSGSATSGTSLIVPVTNARLWSPEDPYLYGFKLELVKNGKVIDSVDSYAGLRKFHIEGNRFYLNNKPIFLRFVLDQGYYPDGIWTAPSDAALKKDIELSMAAGFNGARLHEKVFEERFHYWADKLGYLTWAEYADWGNTHRFSNPQGSLNIEREWLKCVVRDRNHPSILAWTPVNEIGAGWKKHDPYTRMVHSLVAMTRALDPTRPINDASGWVHVETDIFTAHDYEQDPAKFKARYDLVSPDKPELAYVNFKKFSIGYTGQPYVVDEYGGTFWTKECPLKKPEVPANRENWGHGKEASEVEDLIKALTDVLLENPNIAGYTYTQLTDVEQEVNGIYTYQREPKFDIKRLHEIFSAPAAIEKLK